MTNDNFDQEMLEEMKELELDNQQDTEEDRLLTQQEYNEGYGYPEEEKKHNQHEFLARSLIFDEPEKVTFMSPSELGIPLFNLRFLLDVEDIIKHYLDEMAKDLGVENKIATYFRDKIINISSSGMSNNGFVQNLNVTKKMESTRQKIRNIDNLKGGKRR